MKIFNDIKRLAEFEKDIKKLSKRFRSLEEDLEIFISKQLYLLHKLKIDNKPNLHNYNLMKENFKWEDIHKELDFLPGGKLNLAYEAIDRHTLAGVIGIPDPVRMEVVKAFISLREGYVASPELKLEIKKFVTEKLDANAAPKEIEILPVDIRFKNTKFV